MCSSLIRKSLMIMAGLALGAGFLGGCAQPQERAAELYTEAIVLRETDGRQQAIEKLKEAVEVNDEFSLAHSMLGDLYMEAGEYEQSELAYERATELNYYSFHDFFNLGTVRQVLTKFAEAAKAFVRAAQIEPTNAQAHFQAAKSFFEIKEEPDAMENALEYALQAKELASDSGEVAALLGNIYQERKDNQLAIESYKRALEMEGNKPDIMVPLAVSYMRAKDNDAAKEVLEAVLEIDPENVKAYRYLGVYYIKQNNFEQSLENYLMATQFDENDWDARKGLGVAYMLKAISEDDAEAREMALQHWRKSLEINPRQPKLRELLAKYSQ